MKLCLVLFTALTLPLVARAECNDALATDTPPARFVPVGEGDAFLVDRATGLMWQRCALGLKWEQGSCQVAPANGVTWEQALQQGEADTAGGFDDWRLPNIKELESIVDRRCFTPAISTELFPDTPAALFWSSSPNVVRPDVAKVIDFAKGGHRSLGKTSTAEVRLVRDYAAGEQQPQ